MTQLHNQEPQTTQQIADIRLKADTPTKSRKCNVHSTWAAVNPMGNNWAHCTGKWTTERSMGTERHTLLVSTLPVLECFD